MSINELPFGLTDNPNTEICTDNSGQVETIKSSFGNFAAALDYAVNWGISTDYINFNAKYIETWFLWKNRLIPFICKWDN